MNKKVSTLLTVALTLGGSLLSSSAFAQTEITKVNSEATYFLKCTDVFQKPSSQVSGWADINGSEWYVAVNEDGKAYLTTDENEAAYWKVSKSGANSDNYTFETTNGVKLSVSDFDGKGQNGSNIFMAAVDAASTLQNVGFGLSWTGDDGNSYMIGHDSAQGDNQNMLQALTTDEVTKGSSLYIDGFELHEQADSKASNLNDFYNGKGFNFDAKKVLENVEVSGNFFNEEGTPVWALEISSPYEITSTDSEKIIFPAGTYFFVDRVLNDEYTGEAPITPSDINWLKSTFIAVSSTECKETADNDRQNGKGFLLTKVKGEDFTFEEQTKPGQNSPFEGLNIAVYNACFSISDNHSSTNPYAIALEKFYYQAEEGDKKNTEKQKSKGITLSVISYQSASQYVASLPAGNTGSETAISKASHIFGFVSSAVKDGRELLNADQTPAVYTIKFISGNEADKEVFGKFLTVGAGEGVFQWEAKGAAIADETFPIFQYVITNVTKEKSSDKIYSNVTFTNRETGKHFEAKLYPVAGETNRYTLSLNTASELSTIVPFNVNRSTYAVTPAEKPVKFNTDIVIELNKVTPDNYAGFLNVADKTIRTMAFARDVNDTSNKLYAAVVDKGEDEVEYHLNDADKFATESTDAAQWQLVKSPKPESVTRQFVYKNATDNSVDKAAKLDSVCVYTYKLRYVVDGSETEWYLQDANSDMKLAKTEANSKNFVIKENVDGSVSLFIDGSDIFKSNYVADYDKAASIDVMLDKNGSYKYVTDVNRYKIYESESEATNIKTYLDTKHAEISWPAETGHVTIQSELGNYISMNDERDGISVSESNPTSFYLHVADKDAVVPSFFISEGVKEGGNALSERMYMFNPVDSVNYYVTDKGEYDKKYMVRENAVKAIFKAGALNANADTMSVKGVKGEIIKIAENADNNDKNIWAGLNRFKFQIVETEDEDALFYIRQTKAGQDDYSDIDKINPETFETKYLYVVNNKLAWGPKSLAEKFVIKSVEAPTSNEGVAASEVKVVAQDGSIVVKNAAGKNVVVSTILGQVVANEVLTSDNATINVPAGIVVVAVEGESFKVNVK